MTQTPNYDLNMFDSNDDMEENSRLGLNDNADKIDTALKDIQDEVDGLSSPAAADVTYDNTDSGLTAENVQDAIDEELGKIDILSNSVSELAETESGTTTVTDITWERAGKVVTVSIKGVTISSTLATVGGLPTPKNEYLLGLLFYGNNLVGFLQYTNGRFETRSLTGGSTTSYGSLTYIVE